METIQSSNESARIDLSRGELELINNVLNEMANGITMSDDQLSTRLGFSRAEVKSLLKSVNGLLDQMGS